MNKQERVQEVYNYLVFTHAVENQRAFANALNRNEKNISRAIHGDPKFLTDRLLKAIAARYPFISLAWLLTGEGNMLNKDDIEVQPAKAPAPATPPRSASPSLAQAGEEGAGADRADAGADDAARRALCSLSSFRSCSISSLVGRSEAGDSPSSSSSHGKRRRSRGDMMPAFDRSTMPLCISMKVCQRVRSHACWSRFR